MLPVKGTYMPQQLYVQIVTLSVMVFIMTVFLISFITGRPLDTSQLFSLVIPALLQVAQITSNTIISSNQVKAASATSVAEIQVKNGVSK